MTIGPPLSLLQWLGNNARFILAIGCLVAVFLPSLSSALRPILPFLVSMVLGLAMARLDLLEIAKAATKPVEVFKSIGLTLLLMPVSVVIYVLLARIAGLSATDEASLIYLAAAPPIASATSLCFILGFNTRIALQTTLIATLLTPLLGPAITALLLPDAVPISPILLGQRLGVMILGGLALGLTVRFIFGPQRIDQNKLSFDGIAAVAMVLFVIPLFDGVGSSIVDDPRKALWVLVLSFIFNVGINGFASVILRARTDPATAGALGLMWGNRTIAIYIAALPYNPDFSLFVALYQIPMYMTPLIWERFRKTST